MNIKDDIALKKLGVLFLLLLSVTMTACRKESSLKEPDIKAVVSVAPVTEEEYGSIGTYNLTKPSIEDFKNVLIKLDVKAAKGVTNRRIEFPENKDILNKLTSDRYWYGGYSTEDNGDTSDAHYETHFVMYAGNLTTEDIKELLGDFTMKINWNLKDREGQRIIKTGDIITVEDSLAEDDTGEEGRD